MTMEAAERAAQILQEIDYLDGLYDEFRKADTVLIFERSNAMFWWSVPVGLTGFLIAAICVVVGLFLVGFVYDFDQGDMGKVGTVLRTILYIGLIAMAVGFFFWGLDSIWSPYV